MPRFVYRFTGDQVEHFSFLPSDPASRWLEPGDEVACFAAVAHPRLELVKQKSKQTSQQISGDTAQKEG